MSTPEGNSAQIYQTLTLVEYFTVQAFEAFDANNRYYHHNIRTPFPILKPSKKKPPRRYGGKQGNLLIATEENKLAETQALDMMEKYQESTPRIMSNQV